MKKNEGINGVLGNTMDLSDSAMDRAEEGNILESQAKPHTLSLNACEPARACSLLIARPFWVNCCCTSAVLFLVRNKVEASKTVIMEPLSRTKNSQCQISITRLCFSLKLAVFSMIKT
jgi:hypothetical protein